MIQCQVYGDDDIHANVINLPACPRVGEIVVYKRAYRVTRVIFTANDSVVVLWVEQTNGL